MRSTARHVMIWSRWWSASTYETHGKACDNVVEIVKSHYEVNSKASEVNELSDVKDVYGAKAKQGKVLEVVALAPVDTE